MNISAYIYFFNKFGEKYREKKDNKRSGRLQSLWLKENWKKMAFTCFKQWDMKKIKVIANHIFFGWNSLYTCRDEFMSSWAGLMVHCMSSGYNWRGSAHAFMWSADIPSNAWRTQQKSGLFHDDHNSYSGRPTDY